MKIMKTYQIECGKIQGFYNAQNEGIAFRKAMRLNKWLKRDWGLLARFREVIIGHGQRVFKVYGRNGLWKYQKPNYLLKS